MIRFALTGTAGFVAPRHLKAIKDVGGELVASYDPHDSVGILDSYFPKSEFFTDRDKFSRYLSSYPYGVDYFSICSPNYCHCEDVKLGITTSDVVICEKPIVVNRYEFDSLTFLSSAFDKPIYNVMQLRYHEKILELKKVIDNDDSVHNVKLTYVTPRGTWYHRSWKVDEKKSGGILLNIGIHFFDMLLWIFGDVKSSAVTELGKSRASGKLELRKANVDWFLSTRYEDLPGNNKKTYRSILLDGNEVNFSTKFESLHTEVYRNILDGNGYNIDSVLPAFRLYWNLIR